MNTLFGRRRAVTSLVAAAMMALGLTVVVNSPVRATTTFDLTRIQGENRFGTAAAIALDTYASAATAIVANGRSFPDPLAASYLAGAETAPILLAETNAVPQATLDALASLGVSEVVLVGGTAVLSAGVRDQLEDEGYAVRRVAGADRFATARAVAEDPGAENPGSTAGGVTAFLATGTAFPDSLSAGGGAYAGQLPLLLTRPGSLHASAAAAFDNLGIEHVVILGGTSAVSQAVQDEIEESGRTTERLAGDNRFQTNVAVAQWLIANLEFSTTHVDVATGRNFADALAGSTHSGENTRVIVLTGSVPEAACSFLTTHEGTLEGGDIFGGTAAVDTATEDGLEECGGRAESTAGIVTAVDLEGSGNDNVDAGSYTITNQSTGAHRVVTYDGFADQFEVDGNDASLAAFESNLTVGDEIEFFEVGADNPDTANVDDDADIHLLTNVDDRDEGMMGNVNTTDDTFVIVEPFSGVAISDVKDYTGGTFTIDGSSATLSEFDQNVNEGDAIAIDGSAFALTNRVVTGRVTSFNVLVEEVSIGNLGDDATNAQNDRYDWSTGAATTIFRVDGASVNESTFESNISVPDQLSYSRQNGAQVFALTNVAPVAVSGVGADGTGLAPDFVADTINVVNGPNTTAIDYTGVPRFFVNDVLVVESEFEAAYTAGDQVTFTPDNGATPDNESRIELKNADLIGQLRDVTTAENRYDVVNANGTTIYNDLNYTAAVFGGSDTYSVDGAPVPETLFEGAISGADANDQIQVRRVPAGALSGVQTNHAYTTVD